MEAGMTDSPRVLVVDDEPAIRRVLSEFLTMEGFIVDTAPDGRAAVGCLGEQAYDVVISDLKMPRLGGIDLASRLISGGYTTPIILMSAGHQDLAGVSASFVRKPFDFDHLLATIARVLNPPAPRRTSATA